MKSILNAVDLVHGVMAKKKYLTFWTVNVWFYFKIFVCNNNKSKTNDPHEIAAKITRSRKYSTLNFVRKALNLGSKRVQFSMFNFSHL